MSRADLLIEIGCEEIPARMIRGAAAQLRDGLVGVLARAEIPHGAASAWGGSRRLAVRVEAVDPRQPDRDEVVLGPPAKVAFGGDGKPTRAAIGFARKQGIDPEQLERRDTPKGEYAAFPRHVEGLGLGEVLNRDLPEVVGAMSFPKTMRWGDGEHRWVRPVHWVLALHGADPLTLTMFGVTADRSSVAHRFLGKSPVPIADPDAYAAALEAEHVIVDPAVRKARLAEALEEAARAAGGTVVPDPALLDEAADLVEWPGVVVGAFDDAYLELPRELLVTTLRHHQKCFSVQDPTGELRARFIAVANTDRDPSGHIRRGNEWVVGGRLEDARFFWAEDRKSSLAERTGALDKVVFHRKRGSYGDKARRMKAVAEKLARQLALDPEQVEAVGAAATLAKIDLVTGTVGEFPELQGEVGGLLLRAEGGSEEVARAIYEHYRPLGPDDELPGSPAGAVVSCADKLDTIAQLIAAGEAPTGTRDPLGLRRAGAGLFRVVIDRSWPVSLEQLGELSGAAGKALDEFLLDRFDRHLRETGASANEIRAVFRPKVDPDDARRWPLHEIVARTAAIGAVRERTDFAHLVDLTKRVDNILVKRKGEFDELARGGEDSKEFVDSCEAVVELDGRLARESSRIADLEQSGRYAEIVDVMAGFVEPVEKFFDDALVLDPSQPAASLYRRDLLIRLRDALTRSFDIRELAGQAG